MIEYPYKCAVCGNPPGWKLVEAEDFQGKILAFSCHGEWEHHAIEYNDWLNGRHMQPIPFENSPRAGEGVPLPDSIAGVL